MNKLLLTTILLISSTTASAGLKDLKACTAMSETAFITAKSRDQGIPVSKIISILMAQKMPKEAEDSIAKIVYLIYNNPTITPERARDVAFEGCMQ